MLPLLAAGVGLGAATGVAWQSARRRARRAQQLHRALVDLLLNTLSAGDVATAEHSRRVAVLTDALAVAYRLDRRARARLRLAALLHDMGKIDDDFFDIVHSRQQLSPEQRQQIKHHPHKSAHILEPLEQVHPGIMAIVSSHHECWDGSGYPQGLRGEQIPLEARIIAAADVFDALTQRRSYREPLSIEQALDELRRGAGSRFDPELVARIQQPPVLDAWRETVRHGCSAVRTGERED
mgnify:CR=1 FL=1